MNISESYKFVAIVNRNLTSGVALNAIAHMGIAISASASLELKDKMSFIDYVDKSHDLYPSISALSLIVLSGKSNEIKKVRIQAIEIGLHIVYFTESMTGNTYLEQLERTSNISLEDMIFYGCMIFGRKVDIDPITRKLSLWK
jgi:hypothetical protein